MQRFTPSLMLLVVLATFTAGAHADETLAERIEAAIPEGFSGQVVVGDADGVLYSGHYGLADREDNVAVEEDTLFDIGSITKTFTATVVLTLAAAGKLVPGPDPGRLVRGTARGHRRHHPRTIAHPHLRAAAVFGG